MRVHHELAHRRRAHRPARCTKWIKHFDRSHTTVEPTPGGGKPTKTYHLTERQLVYAIMNSGCAWRAIRTARARSRDVTRTLK